MTNEELHNWCHKAGVKAAEAHTPEAMVVQQRKHVLDDNSPVVKEWHVSGGVCGFASVVISPGNCSFARWAKKNLRTYKHYYGGLEIPVSEYGQSMTTKEAYASGYCKMFKALNKDDKVTVRVSSRMD